MLSIRHGATKVRRGLPLLAEHHIDELTAENGWFVDTATLVEVLWVCPLRHELNDYLWKRTDIVSNEFEHKPT